MLLIITTNCKKIKKKFCSGIGQEYMCVISINMLFSFFKVLSFIIILFYSIQSYSSEL